MTDIAQVEKRREQRKTGRRRLSNIRVNEISLVDNPAVPDATFVIAKRDEEPMSQPAETETTPEITVEKTETPATEPAAGEPVEKAGRGDQKLAGAFLSAIKNLRGVASELSPTDLMVLSQLMDYTAQRFGDVEAVKNAGFLMLKSAEAPSLVPTEKPDDETQDPVVAEQPAPAAEGDPKPKEPTEEPAPASPKRSLLEEINEALRTQNEAQAKRAAEEQEQALVGAISQLAGVLTKASDRVDALERRLNKARGKVEDAST